MAKYIKPPKVIKTDIVFINEEQVQVLLNELKTAPHQQGVMIKLFLLTGLRRGELCGLEWKGIEDSTISIKRASQYIADKGIFTKEPKTKFSIRVLPMSTSMKKLLDSHRRWQQNLKNEMGEEWTENDRLFTTAYGTPTHPDTVTGWFDKFIKKIDIPKVTVHGLRHYVECCIMESAKKNQPFKCPLQFQKAYDAFNKACIEREYSYQGFQAIIKPVRNFLIFLDNSNIELSEKITAPLISKFLSVYISCKPRYIATIISGLKNYLNFLYKESFISKCIINLLPKVRIVRNSFIPSAWKTDDIKKLLESIDRGNATGKRDYAILLTVVRLGLRVSDIRSLRLSNLNWASKKISIVMQKTKQPIELPILEDIGWAIIDYLKNGRPETAYDILFIKHKAPYDGFGQNDCLQHTLHRYMNKAGIEIPQNRSCGLHSLRSTLALAMLEHKTPLPVISGVLGHQNMETTSIYLKIDIEGLKKCIIDPDEVFSYEK